MMKRRRRCCKWPGGSTRRTQQCTRPTPQCTLLQPSSSAPHADASKATTAVSLVALEPQPQPQPKPKPKPEAETEPVLAPLSAGFWALPLTTLVLERVSPSRMSWKKKKEKKEKPQVRAARHLRSRQPYVTSL